MPSTHLKNYDHKKSGTHSLEQERDIPAPTRSRNNGKLECTWLATPALCLTPPSPPTPSTLAFRHLLACTRILVPGSFKPLGLDLHLPWDALPPLGQTPESTISCPLSLVPFPALSRPRADDSVSPSVSLPPSETRAPQQRDHMHPPHCGLHSATSPVPPGSGTEKQSAAECCIRALSSAPAS